MRGFDKTFLGSYDFAPEELLFQIDRVFSYPGGSESKTPWWIGDWDHERDDAIVVGVEPVDGRAWIGSEGLAWHTERLAWDDLHALRVEAGTLIAEGFDPPVGRMVSFCVDLNTGRSQDAPNPDSRSLPI